MSKKYGKTDEIVVANRNASRLSRNDTLPISTHSGFTIPAASCHANEDKAFDSQPYGVVSAEQFERSPRRLLTIRQVADLLQVPVSWVYGRTRKRSLERLRGYRLGKYWRFDHDEVLAWVARHKTTRDRLTCALH